MSTEEEALGKLIRQNRGKHYIGSREAVLWTEEEEDGSRTLHYECYALHYDGKEEVSRELLPESRKFLDIKPESISVKPVDPDGSVSFTMTVTAEDIDMLPCEWNTDGLREATIMLPSPRKHEEDQD